MAVHMNRPIFTLATGTPTLRAALASPPAAKIQLPTRVRSSTQVATRSSPATRRTDIGTPGTCGVPSVRAAIQPLPASQANSR